MKISQDSGRINLKHWDSDGFCFTMSHFSQIHSTAAQGGPNTAGPGTCQGAKAAVGDLPGIF